MESIDFFQSNLLTVIMLFPLVWGLFGLLIPTQDTGGQKFLARWTLVGGLIVFALSMYLYVKFEPNGEEFLFTEKVPWIESFGIYYALGIDGISLLLIVLTTFLAPLVTLSSFSAIKTRHREYYFFLNFIQTGMLGAFMALDVFLFYIFWEAMLIPMYFLIGIWGGKERIYASMKFFLYTVVGSLLMLVAIFYLAYQHQLQYGTFSTGILDFYRIQIEGGGWLSPQSLLFLAFALAFAIKVPLFPFHTWLPDAHVQAPTAGSVILAGVLLKLGGYGFIRLAFPLFPDAIGIYQMPFIILGVIAIIYGAWVAMVQPDVKKLVAYSSVSHMGYVIVGLFALNSIGVTGSVYQMLSHGISTGALFLLVGMIYERRHTRDISAFGGISKKMPVFAVAFLIVTLSSIALPGTNGFVGEFLILLGLWKTSPVLAAIAGLGVIFGAVYMLWMFQRVMFGPVDKPENENLKDLNAREKMVLLPLIVLIFVMGLFPNIFLSKMGTSVERFLHRSRASAVTDQIEEMTKKEKEDGNDSDYQS